MMFTRKFQLIGLTLLLAFGDAYAIDLESLVRGEQYQLANDADRYNFVRYELLREDVIGPNLEFSRFEVCEAKELQNKLFSEFNRLKINNYASYRDYGYCYYLKNVNLMEPSVDVVNEWLSTNGEKVHYYHSHEAAIDYYVSLNTMSDWQCNNLRSFLYDYKKDAGHEHSEGLQHLSKLCG